jgi:hypothetical protein
VSREVQQRTRLAIRNVTRPGLPQMMGTRIGEKRV